MSLHLDSANNIKQVGFMGSFMAIANTFTNNDRAIPVLDCIDRRGPYAAGCRTADDNQGIDSLRCQH